MFADAEALVRKYLADNLSGSVRVATKVPSTRPDVFVRVWRTGGTAMNRIVDRPQITVQAWAKDSVAASKLAGECRQLLLAASGHMPLVRAIEETSGIYYDPDPGTNTDRYTFTHQITMRAPRA